MQFNAETDNFDKWLEEHESEKAEFDDLYEELGMCGCGEPQSVKDFFRDLIEIQNDNSIEFKEKTDKIDKLFKETKSYTLFSILFHFLEKFEHSTHNYSIGGSQLTEKGKRFLYLLKEHV